MDGKPAEQVVNELFPYFEALETRTLAILQLLKDKGLTTDEQFAPYLEQAANASNVKWLAARVRVERLVASALKEHEDSGKAEEPKAEPVEEKKAADNSDKKTAEKSDTQPKTKDGGEKSEEKPTESSEENDADKPGNQTTQEVRGNAGAEGSDGREKDVSGGNERAKESGEKKPK